MIFYFKLRRKERNIDVINSLVEVDGVTYSEANEMVNGPDWFCLPESVAVAFMVTYTGHSTAHQLDDFFINPNEPNASLGQILQEALDAQARSYGKKLDYWNNYEFLKAIR